MDRNFHARFDVVSDFMAHLQHRQLAGTLVVYDYTLANLQNDTEFLEFAEDIKQYHFQDLETPSQGNLKFIRTRLSLNKFALVLTAMQEIVDIRGHNAHQHFKQVDLDDFKEEFRYEMGEANQDWDSDYHGRDFCPEVFFALNDVIDPPHCKIYCYIGNPYDLLDHDRRFYIIQSHCL